MSRTAPHLRKTSRAALSDVPSDSMNVVGWATNWSVSLAAIQGKRVDSGSFLAIRPACTRCQRTTESALAQPTQDPVAPWSPIFHQVSSRRSFERGADLAEEASNPASSALCSCQSLSVFGDGTQLRMRVVPDLSVVVRVVRARVVAIPAPSRRLDGRSRQVDGQRPEDQEQVERGQSVRLGEGEVVDLTVDDLPGAGYTWVVRDLPDGPDRRCGRGRAAAGRPPASVARPGTLLRLQGDRAGTYELHLDLVRPWEPAGTPPVDVRRVTVQVDPPASVMRHRRTRARARVAS